MPRGRGCGRECRGGGNYLCRELGSVADHSDPGWKVSAKMSQEVSRSKQGFEGRWVGGDETFSQTWTSGRDIRQINKSTPPH